MTDTTQADTQPRIEVYDFGVKVLWQPAIVQKFPDRLQEIALKILEEVEEIGSCTIYIHLFQFDESEIMITTSWDEDLDMLSATADIVAYQKVVAHLEEDDEGEPVPVLMPVPASETDTIH